MSRVMTSGGRVMLLNGEMSHHQQQQPQQQQINHLNQSLWLRNPKTPPSKQHDSFNVLSPIESSPFQEYNTSPSRIKRENTIASYPIKNKLKYECFKENDTNLNNVSGFDHYSIEGQSKKESTITTRRDIKAKRSHTVWNSSDRNVWRRKVDFNCVSLEKTPGKQRCVLTKSETSIEFCKNNPLIDAYQPKLPLLKTGSCGLFSISPNTVCDIIDGKYRQLYDYVFFIDCRFDYEYEGGHVIGSQNCQEHSQLENFFTNEQYKSNGTRVCIIFYCEFSSHRGPKAYNYFRNKDRQLNKYRYPNLFYPEIYLMEGGYNKFYQLAGRKNERYCVPDNYIEMHDKRYKRELNEKFKTYRKKKVKQRFLSRSCSSIQFERR